MHELHNRFIQLCCQARTPVRLDASGRWFICLTVFRVGHEVESRSAEVSQDLVSRFRKRVLDDSLAIPGVPNFIAFEGVPSVFAKFGVPSRETSADWCAGEHVKDWLLKKPPPTLLRPREGVGTRLGDNHNMGKIIGSRVGLFRLLQELPGSKTSNMHINSWSPRLARAHSRTEQRLIFCELPDATSSEPRASSSESDSDDCDYGALMDRNDQRDRSFHVKAV